MKHGRHFTFRTLGSNSAITFVAPSVTGSLVSDERPFVADGLWLQIFIPNSFLDTMESSLMFLNEPVIVSKFIMQ